jgi:hypothetical protein
VARSKKRRPEAISGGFSAIPWAVLDGEAFQGASPRAKALLFEVIRQLDGRNNGHLNLAANMLRKRGWKSTDAISAAKAELLARGLLIRTRTGGLNIGPDQFAVTWLAISNFVGLEIGPAQFHPGAWRFEEGLPPPKKRHTRTPKKRDDSSASRNSTVPPHGTVEASTVPPHGTKTAHFGGSAVPPHGANVITNHPPEKCARTLPAVPRPTDRTFPVMRVAGWRFVGAAPSNRRGAPSFQVTPWKSEAERPSINPEGV